jgi:pimeloyl-ACP methyl ester carboxylesterase
MAGNVLEVTAADGRRLEASVGGAAEGPLIVTHHGTPGEGTRFWPPHEEAALERGLRLAGYTRPGARGSERHAGRSVGDCAADAAAVADALGAERFFTIGGSGGGPHALACAALLPERVLGAATIAGVGPRGAEGLDWLAGMGDENIEEFAAADAGPEELEEFISGWAEKLREITGAEVLDSLGDLVSEPDAAVLTGEYADFAAEGIREALTPSYWGWFDDDLAIIGDWGFELDSIAVPVTIWQGREDRFVPLAHGEWLAENVPGARAQLLDDHGHLSLALAHFGAILDDVVGAAAGA